MWSKCGEGVLGTSPQKLQMGNPVCVVLLSVLFVCKWLGESVGCVGGMGRGSLTLYFDVFCKASVSRFLLNDWHTRVAHVKRMYKKCMSNEASPDCWGQEESA